jgi:hypothetical protein
MGAVRLITLAVVALTAATAAAQTMRQAVGGTVSYKHGGKSNQLTKLTMGSVIPNHDGKESVNLIFAGDGMTRFQANFIFSSPGPVNKKMVSGMTVIDAEGTSTYLPALATCKLTVVKSTSQALDLTGACPKMVDQMGKAGKPVTDIAVHVDLK